MGGGYVRGQVVRYRDARGRFAIDPSDWSDPRTWGPFPDYAKIWLTEDTYAKVDHEDYPRLVGSVWSLHTDGHTKLYARCRRVIEGRERTIYLHRLVATLMGPPPSPRHTYVDHKNGDGLDCRRSNLRWATPRENRLNLRGAFLHQGDLFHVKAEML